MMMMMMMMMKKKRRKNVVTKHSIAKKLYEKSKVRYLLTNIE